INDTTSQPPPIQLSYSTDRRFNYDPSLVKSSNGGSVAQVRRLWGPVEEAQDHAELTSHTNFAESTEAVLNLVCTTCGKPCRCKTESDLHTKRTGHADFEDKTAETTKPISLEAPKPVPMDVDDESPADASTTSQTQTEGNSSAEAAVNWVVEHENDPDIDEIPLVPANTKVEAPKPSLTPEEVKQRAQELRERARKKKEEEEKRMEREREKERIRIGKELLEAKRIEEENERKRLLALRKAEKEEEQRAREKIRQKLEEDKAERRRRLGLPPEDPATAKPSTPVVEEKKSSLPVRPATKQEKMRECLRSLKQNHKDDDFKVKRAFQTLHTYIANVAKNPNEEKFRKIKLNNLNFQDRVGSLTGGIEFLELCGFSKTSEEFLFLPRDKVDMAVLNSAGSELNSAINNPFFGASPRVRVKKGALKKLRTAKKIKLRKEPKPTPAKTTTLPAKKKVEKPPPPPPPPASLLPKPTLPLNRAETHFISLIHSTKTTSQLRQIHAQILLRDLSFSSHLTTQLISSSSLHNSIDYVISIFDHYDNNNLFTFNALIRGLEKNSRLLDSITRFKLMLRSGVTPDRLTYPFVLKSIARLYLEELGASLHCVVLKCGAEFDGFVRVSLLDMYVKVGKLGSALKVFDESPHRFGTESGLLWNVVISGCCKAGHMKKAVKLVEAMPVKDIGPWNSLVDGFFKVGDLRRATKLFERMPEKDVVSWTIMVNGLSLCGYHEKALAMFFRMLEDGMRPNDFTVVFLAVLTACVHSRKIDLGRNFFDSMKLDYCIEPSMKHYVLIVDLLGRAGRLKEAVHFIQSMPVPDFRGWVALFCASKAHRNIKMAALASQKILELEPKRHGTYVFLENVYTAIGRLEDAARVRSLMKKSRIVKDPGWSYIEMDGHAHSFVAGDVTHSDTKEIYL
ncbi:hypothetical protein Tsubulata_002538, partial [Turnera subulata]